MSEIKEGKKPEQEGGKGAQEQNDEVGGRSREVAYICWNCRATNWVPSHWSYFYCWSCGALNYT